jgi:hypothetical protein
VVSRYGKTQRARLPRCHDALVPNSPLTVAVYTATAVIRAAPWVMASISVPAISDTSNHTRCSQPRSPGLRYCTPRRLSYSSGDRTPATGPAQLGAQPKQCHRGDEAAPHARRRVRNVEARGWSPIRT